MNPLETLTAWVADERVHGIPFARGAVLGTQGENGMPRTRMLGVLFDTVGNPRFHASPTSRKVLDISINNAASLTFGFQKSMRSVSLEGYLVPLSKEQLAADWENLDTEFRKNYLVFGHQTGRDIQSLDDLRVQQASLARDAELHCPDSFIGYAFHTIQRIAFYSVAERDFATYQVFEFDQEASAWIGSLRTP